MNDSSIKLLVGELSNLLVQVATGGPRIDDVDEVYKTHDLELRKISKSRGVTVNFPWRSLWEWHGYFSKNLPTWASRREYISQLRKELDDNCDLIEQQQDIENPKHLVTSESVNIAIHDLDLMIREGRFVSAVDRTHTALHGHLLWLCREENIEIQNKDVSITKLMKMLRENHPGFSEQGQHQNQIRRILMSLGDVLDSLNQLRNNASVAHPNDRLLPEPEARLAVNAGLTLLNYLNTKANLEH